MPKSVGCFSSPGLVFCITIEPELRRALIKTYHHCIWTLVRQKFDEHRGKTIDGIGNLPGGSNERVGQGEKCAKRQRMAIDQYHFSRVAFCDCRHATAGFRNGFFRAHISSLPVGYLCSNPRRGGILVELGLEEIKRIVDRNCFAGRREKAVKPLSGF